MRFRGYWGRARRVAVSGCIGATLSALAAMLISFALLDIAVESWARNFYGGVYLAGAAVFLWLDDDSLLRPYRLTLAVLFGATGLVSLALHWSLGGANSVPLFVRVAMFSLVGMSLCLSVVLSCFFLAWVVVEHSCGPERSRDIHEALLSPERAVWVCFVALAEGIYFGLIFGMLEQTGNRDFVLPHDDSEFALPVAALLGSLAGGRIECLRQAHENCYATIQCVTVDADDKELWLNTDLTEVHGQDGGVLDVGLHQ